MESSRAQMIVEEQQPVCPILTEKSKSNELPALCDKPQITHEVIMANSTAYEILQATQNESDGNNKFKSVSERSKKDQGVGLLDADYSPPECYSSHRGTSLLRQRMLLRLHSKVLEDIVEEVQSYKDSFERAELRERRVSLNDILEGANREHLMAYYVVVPEPGSVVSEQKQERQQVLQLEVLEFGGEKSSF